MHCFGIVSQCLLRESLRVSVPGMVRVYPNGDWRRILTGSKPEVTFQVTYLDRQLKLTGIVSDDDTHAPTTSTTSTAGTAANAQDTAIQVTAGPVSGAAPDVSYTYTFEIGKDAEPRLYHYHLQFTAKNKDVRAYFTLPVSASDAGKLDQVKAKVPVMLEGNPGDTLQTDLNIRNNFRDYAVTVESVAVTSTPPGLIKAATVPIGDRDHPIRIQPGVAKAIHVPTIEVVGYSVSQLVSDVTVQATKPSVNFTIQYRDDQQAGQSPDRDPLQLEIDPVPIQIRPNYPSLLFWATMGAVAGTALMSVARLINLVNSDDNIKFRAWSARNQILYHCICVVVAVAVFVFGLVFQIEILAFQSKIHAANDNPIVGFVVGFVAGLAGPNAFFKYFNEG